jgi:hypothetical protein
MPPDLGPWAPYDVATVERLFAPLDARWWLSGGCALDLFLGYETRPHGDIDVSVRRDDWPRVAARLGNELDVHVARNGVLTPIAQRVVTDDVHNLWARDRTGGPWRVQVNLEPGTTTHWLYRRDPDITRPWDDVVWRDRVVPYVNPAVQLLWKAKHSAPKEQTDFDVVAPRLAPAERAWLADAIRRAHPTSPWADVLTERGRPRDQSV